jgi:succinate dehydrogenase / fumarate reductase membrane anchor subunit
MTLRSPLGKARGLGSAKEGVHHFWMQRVTAVALIPLTIYFVISVISLIGASHREFLSFFTPCNATLMILTVTTAVYHGMLGIQTVIEDYVHCPGKKVASLLLAKYALVFVGVFLTVCILKFSVFSAY